MENGAEVSNYPVQGDTTIKETSSAQKLPQDIVSLLTERMADEFSAHYFYMNSANWCKNAGYFKAGKFFEKESLDELEHANGIQDYLTQWNVYPDIPQVKTKFDIQSLPEIVKTAYSLEYDLFTKYNQTSRTILAKDPSTFDFLGKYREIQNKSVAEYSDLLSVLDLIDPSNKFELLYFENNYF